MSLPNQNAPRMRRHKRRINDDGSELAHAVRSFVDQHVDESSPLLARQADSFNPVGPGRGVNAPPMGGNGGATDPTDTTSDTRDASPTSTRGSANGNGNGNGNGNARPTTTSSTSTPVRNLFPTTTATSSSTNFLDGILHDLTADSSSTSTSSSTSSTPSSTSTSSSSTTTSSSSSTRSSSTSSSTSSVSVPPSETQTRTATSDRNNADGTSTTQDNNNNNDNASSSRTSIVPITATAVVTSTPTASLAAATASSSPKSSTSSAGPIIGIVAGALVGVVVLSGLIGFLFKKYNKKDDPYEANPFDRDAFQRHSAMIPDHFESDEGHGGAGGMSPEMSEHYQYNNFGPQYESGISAGAAGAMGAMAAHNENGGPRPPTMFAKHAAGVQQNQPQVGGYYKDGDFSNQMPSMPPHSDYHAPPTAAFAGHHADHYLDEPGFGQQRSVSPAPQLPPLAAFGGDPYSIAGVGRGQQQAQNVANPYAHLDRGHGAPMGGFTPGAVVPHHSGSGSVSSGGDSADQRHASISAAEALAAGLAHQSSLNRSASPNHAQHDEARYDTAGRPGTSEVRSGTPDLPNVQQTYALAGDVATAAGAHRISAGSQDMLNHHAERNPFENPHSAQHQQYQQPPPQAQQQQQAYDHNQQLQVRNLVPQGGLSAGQRPISTASSFADPEDAYGGVY